MLLTYAKLASFTRKPIVSDRRNQATSESA